MLKSLYVDNYKCLVNFELPFRDVTLLLGANGSGKSSVLDVVHRLRQLLVSGTAVGEPDAFPLSTLTRWDQRGVQTVALDLDVDGEAFKYRLEVEHERETARARVKLESLATAEGPLFRCELGEAQLYRDDHSEGPRLSVDWKESFLARVSGGKDNKRLGRFMDFMRGLVICGLHPPSFVASANRESAMLQRDGSNFAAWYRHFVQEQPELAVDIAAKLRSAIDGFRGLRLERAGADSRTMQVTFAGDCGDYTLQLDEISDGERALMVLYALLGLASEQPSTLLVDEPDNYLALPEVQPWLMALCDACDNAKHQAIVCSHHPELIDYFGAERGLLLERTSGGVTRARDASTIAARDGLRLSEHVARGWTESWCEFHERGVCGVAPRGPS